jgi:hypothetical protein
MSERLLDAFRDEAERYTPLPAFEPIEAAGRRRRRRRHAAVGVVAACTLAAATFLASLDGEPREPRPAEDSSFVTPYPTHAMVTLQAGTYEITPSPGSSLPVVRFTVPPGWNAGLFPERFEGLGDRVTYDAEVNRALLAKDPDWYAGVHLLDVRWVAQRGCSDVDVTDTASLARALTNIPGLEVISGPESTVRLGHPAVHLRLREQGGQPPSCRRETVLRDATGNVFTHAERGTMTDAWVIDVDDRPVLVGAYWTPGTPRAEVDAALGIVDSVEVLDPE